MPAQYPYGERDRLSVLFHNHDLKTNPQATPPASAHGGSQRFKQWIDTSVYPAVLRMCTIDGASASYVPSQWMTMAYLYWGDAAPRIEWGPQGGYLPLTGGTLSGGLRINSYLSVHGDFGVESRASILGDLSVGGTTITGDFHANVGTVYYDFVIGRNCSISGALAVGGDINTTLGMYSIYVQTNNAYVSSGLTVGNNLNMGGLLTCNDIHTNAETVNGNCIVVGAFSAGSINTTNLAALGNITSATMNMSYLAASGAGTSISASQDIVAGRTMFATGMQCNNILVNSNADIAINVPAGGITAVHGLFANRVSVGGNDVYGLWAPSAGCTARSFHVSGPSGYDDQNFYIAIGGNAKLINFSPQHYLWWNMANGDFTYVGAGVSWLELQLGSRYIVNKQGPFQAWGYLYNSDRRSKTNIVPSEYGLEAILALQTVRFNRLRKSVEEDYPPADIGFVAQDVLKVIPEAIHPAHMTFADGSGGADTDEPALSMSIMPIVAAMVKAFQEINARLTALEGAE